MAEQPADYIDNISFYYLQIFSCPFTCFSPPGYDTSSWAASATHALHSNASGEDAPRAIEQQDDHKLASNYFVTRYHQHDVLHEQGGHDIRPEQQRHHVLHEQQWLDVPHEQQWHDLR